MDVNKSLPHQVPSAGLGTKSVIAAIEDATVLGLDGDLVFEGVEEFSNKLNALLGVGTKHIILDMGSTRYISARAIGVIASAVRHLRERKKDLKLVNVSEPIKHLFTITGLSRTIGIYQDERSMLASLGPQVGMLEKQCLW
ncbi:MAG: STAS domain-containing protein [Candidatus Brocadiales bacterium]